MEGFKSPDEEVDVSETITVVVTSSSPTVMVSIAVVDITIESVVVSLLGETMTVTTGSSAEE